MLPGVQEHENGVQLSPEKGYLIGNESEICIYINASFANGKQIKLLIFCEQWSCNFY